MPTTTITLYSCDRGGRRLPDCLWGVRGQWAGGHFGCQQQDLKYRSSGGIKPATAGTDLGLSVEREITPWSPSYNLYRGTWKVLFWKKLEEIKYWLGASRQSQVEAERTMAGPVQRSGESAGWSNTSAIKDEADKHLTDRPGWRAQAHSGEKRVGGLVSLNQWKDFVAINHSMKRALGGAVEPKVVT